MRQFPDVMPIVSELLDLTPLLIEFNSNVWKIKKDAGISLNTEISDVSIPERLHILEKSLIRMHRII